ncbi:MAG: metallophosphoesterase [Myxococcota bacterium]
MLRYLVFFVVMSGLLVGTHVYLYRRLVRDTGLDGHTRRAATWLLVGLALLIPASFVLPRLLPRDDAWPLPLLGYTWMGLLFYLMLGLGILELPALVRWLGRRLRCTGEGMAPPVDPGRRQFLAQVSAGGAVLGSGGLGLLGFHGARGGDFAEPEVEVALERLPRALEGYRLVQLSDIHVGPTVDKGFLREVVERANALKPDAICITGDLVDGSVAHLGRDVAELGRLAARDGVFFVTGNHEYYSGAPDWMEFLEKLDIRVLQNERLALGDRGPGGASFDLAGVHDHTAARFGVGHAPDVQGALDGRDPERELVLLAHQPRQIYAAEGHGVGLQLSGHTHGGQLWPFGAATALVQPYLAGLHRHGDGTQIYVSRGTGYWGPPMRIGAPAEITSLVLVGS